MQTMLCGSRTCANAACSWWKISPEIVSLVVGVATVFIWKDDLMFCYALLWHLLYIGSSKTCVHWPAYSPRRILHLLKTNSYLLCQSKLHSSSHLSHWMLCKCISFLWRVRQHPSHVLYCVPPSITTLRCATVPAFHRREGWLCCGTVPLELAVQLKRTAPDYQRLKCCIAVPLSSHALQCNKISVIRQCCTLQGGVKMGMRHPRLATKTAHKMHIHT